MADTSIEYRPACAGDVTRLAEMRWAMRLEGQEIPSKDHREFLDECAAFYLGTIDGGTQSHWVAADPQRLVGTLSLHRVELIPRPCRFNDSFGCITNNYVLPELRGCGIAGELLKHVIAAARAEGLELLIVWPSEPAIPFYRRAGFQWENEVMELRLRDYAPITAPGTGT